MSWSARSKTSGFCATGLSRGKKLTDISRRRWPLRKLLDNHGRQFSDLGKRAELSLRNPLGISSLQGALLRHDLTRWRTDGRRHSFATAEAGNRPQAR